MGLALEQQIFPSGNGTPDCRPTIPWCPFMLRATAQRSPGLSRSDCTRHRREAVREEEFRSEQRCVRSSSGMVRQWKCRTGGPRRIQHEVIIRLLSSGQSTVRCPTEHDDPQLAERAKAALRHMRKERPPASPIPRHKKPADPRYDPQSRRCGTIGEPPVYPGRCRRGSVSIR